MTHEPYHRRPQGPKSNDTTSGTTFSDLGISRNESSRYQKLAKMSEADAPSLFVCWGKCWGKFGMGKITELGLKALTLDDVGSWVTDDGGLRGRVVKDRQGRIAVRFEYRYRAGERVRSLVVGAWPSSNMRRARFNARACSRFWGSRRWLGVFLGVYLEAKKQKGPIHAGYGALCG